MIERVGLRLGHGRVARSDASVVVDLWWQVKGGACGGSKGAGLVCTAVLVVWYRNKAEEWNSEASFAGAFQ